MVRNLVAFTLLTLAAMVSGQSPVLRPSVGAGFDGAFPVNPPAPQTGWTVVNAFPNLSFQNPMGIAQMPGSSLVVVWEREGRVRAFANDASSATAAVILDISAKVQGWDDCGLLNLAFHPQFDLGDPAHRQVFLYYTAVPPGGVLKGSATVRPPTLIPLRERLSRFDVDGDGVILPGSETVLIDQTSGNVWHNGGGMFFHPVTGFLYLTVGDDYVSAHSQKVTGGLFGGILRLDVDMQGGAISHPIPRQPVNGTTANYFIPNDNPWVGRPGVLEEFYSIGLRSPHRMTHDAVTDSLYFGDVGLDKFEELNRQSAGPGSARNFQWNGVGESSAMIVPREGPGFVLSAAQLLVSGVTTVDSPPLSSYSHSTGDGKAVIGGFVYRGAEFAGQAEVNGRYLFADNISGKLWALNESGPSPVRTLLTVVPNGPGFNAGQNYVGISSFGTDSSGQVYLTRLSGTGGQVLKLVRSSQAQPQMPLYLQPTGLVQQLRPLSFSSKLLPYRPNAPFWSDGAEKTRFIAVPDGQTIGYAATGEWTFPEGTTLVKHFDLPAEDGVSPPRRIETRVMVKSANGVHGASYRWTSAGSARLVKENETEIITSRLAPLGNFTSLDLGGGTLVGLTRQYTPRLYLYSAGSGVAGSSDQARFASIQRSGDFDLHCRVERLLPNTPTALTPNARLSLMARAGTAADAPFVAIHLRGPSNYIGKQPQGVGFSSRATAAAGVTELAESSNALFPNAWLRLQRVGDLFIASQSQNGVDWQEVGRTTLALPALLNWGFAVASHDPSRRVVGVVHLPVMRQQRWSYPGQQACILCHTGVSGGVLGVNARQLNGSFSYPGGHTGNQLQVWSDIGMFSNPPNSSAIASADALKPLTDTTASLEDRVRSYLDSNCSSCHRAGGVQAMWDARYDVPLASQGIINGAVGSNLGIPGAAIVKPGSVEESILHLRLDHLGIYQMPPLGKGVIDRQAVRLLEEWITSLPP
jgi:glucose/arabinose dehydrogenase/mono/diheme cytochrome c family protein